MTQQDLIDYGAEAKSFVYGDAKKAVNRRFIPSRTFDVLPGLSIYDPRYKVFMRNLAENLAKSGLVKEDIDSGGFYNISPGISDEKFLRTIPNTIRLPLDFGRNAFEKEMTAEEDEILQEVVRCCMSEPIFDEGRITRDSSSGFPFFSSKLETKQRLLSLASKNISNIVKMLMTDNYESLLNYYGLTFMSSTQIRLQVDSYMKERSITPFQSQYGDTTLTMKSKTAIDDFWQSMRTRVVCAMPGLANNMMTACFESFKRGMYAKYPLALKHRGGDELLEKMAGSPYIIGVDIKQFDSNSPKNVILRIIDLLPFNEVGNKMVKNLLLGPWFVSDDGLNHVSMATESIIKPSFGTWKGMPSGIFFTTVMNTIQVIFYKFIEYKRFFNWSVRDVHRFLNFELEVKPLILSDDGIDLINDKRVYDQIIANGFENKFVQFEREKGVTFMGLQFYKDTNGKLRFCNSMQTYLSKKYQPERDINSRFRPLPLQGFLMRREVFKNNPDYELVSEIEDKVYYDIFGTSLKVQEERWANEERLLKFDASGSSQADAEVLLDPAKLHYKYSEDEISDSVLDAISSRIDSNVSKIMIKELIDAKYHFVA